MNIFFCKCNKLLCKLKKLMWARYQKIDATYTKLRFNRNNFNYYLYIVQHRTSVMLVFIYINCLIMQSRTQLVYSSQGLK